MAESSGADKSTSVTTLVQNLIASAARPAAIALASLLLAVASLLQLAPAAQMGQLDTSSEFGLPLPGRHTLEISSAVRLAVSLLALALAAAAVRHLRASRSDPSAEPTQLTSMVAGAAVIVALVAAVLNFVALADALLNAPVYSVYNHIGS